MLVRPLAALRATDVPIAGGKGANLGELVAAGFTVPDGFVLTTEAYDAAARAAGVDPRDPSGARARLLAAPVPDRVGGDALRDAIRRCWASLWNERAVAYRASNGIDPATVSLAVVVQRMVDASAAGVLFTADPVTGTRRRAVIDAVAGLGDRLVSGAV